MKKQINVSKKTLKELEEDVEEEYRKLNLSKEDELKLRDLNERFFNIAFKMWQGSKKKSTKN